MANLENGAKVVMYNIGAEKLVGYNNGEVSKKEIAVTDDDRAAYVFTVKKSGSTVALVNSTSYGPQASYSSKNSKFSFKWSTAPNYFAVYSGSNYTQLYVTGARNNGYLAFSNSKMTVTTSGNYETSKWNFYEVTQETSGSTGDGAQTVHKQLKAWQTDAGYQEVGYIGLGNKNQVLAMACVSVSADDVPTLTYRLFGHTGYLSAISVYARMRDKGQDYFPDGSYAKYENTFAHIFDYRNPEKNCGALFLGTTHEVPAAGEKTTFTSNLKLPAGEYVIYLVANVRSAEEIGGLKNLPLIGGAKRNFTRVGGVIDMVSNKTINTVNNYSGEGGGRVLVPKFKLLYAPRYEDFATSEEYSRYYRIPAITRASDGTLVALSDARKMHIHDVTNSIDVVSRRSSDNGKTWSDYVVIFQGSQSGEDCYDWKGYGDAAVASFANGTVIATAIHGFGLAGSSTDPATDVVWKVSRDNGKSWSSEYTMDQKLFGGLRGNISPGNICVANEGYIKGKALVGLRTSTSPNNGYTNTSASHQRIYCLTYDPDKNTWTNVTTGWDNYNYIEVSGDLDETQFVQIGDNEYLMSARYYGTGFRKFYRLKFTSATTATVTEVSQSGMTLAGGCNGDLINYTTANQGTYVIHTIPKDWAHDGDNARTSLTAYYAKASASDRLDWTRSLDLFDPFDNTSGGEKKSGIGALDESAQYSSLSMQEDGTIAVLMEAYPYAIRHMDGDRNNNTAATHWGDWVMGQYYINLRIGDLIPGAEQPVAQVIDAPVISPKSSTYDSYVTTDRPEITISHKNYV
ncbi:MAG: sialidase family protein, partial [Sodaliphilus sp.]|nr:sialidase family protein [Sodaliphilus sp.]